VLRDRLNHAMSRSIRNERLVGLMLLNVNKFKDINEALGYEAGDAILAQTRPTCATACAIPTPWCAGAATNSS
jgi:GGDEF domain-containing protein